MHRPSAFGFLLAIALAAALGAGCNARSAGRSTPATSGATASPGFAVNGAPTAQPTSAAVAGALTYGVQVDGKPTGYNGSFAAFFPAETLAHPGDAVRFVVVDTGQPHTVTLGRLVDAAAAAVAKAGPANASKVPELAALPVLVASGGSDAIQSAGSPCFVTTGAPPKDVCTGAQLSQPEFNGRQSYFNAGWLGADQPFTLRLAPDIAPGSYAIICLVHRETMIGKITVVDPAKATPSVDAEAATGRAELDALTKALQPAADAVVSAPASAPLAGNLSSNVPGGFVTAFGPSTISVPVGGTVTWTVRGPHTISFNAPEVAKSLRVVLLGAVHFNPRAGLPAGGPMAPEAPLIAAPGAPPIVFDAGAWDGTGFFSSGTIVSMPPGPTFLYRVKFTKAGTYPYLCLIHPGMTGTVQVGA